MATDLTLNELQTVTNLTLTGKIDARDFKIMRDNMPSLAVVDLSDVTIVEYNGTEGTWIATNYPANTIPEDAFVNISSEGKKCLTSIILPQSLLAFGSYSFYDCTGLTSINIPSTVTIIGYRAFSYCSSLTKIELPSSVISIGYMAFFSCSGLTTVVIPSSVTSIGNQVFWGCSSLTTIEIPSSVTSIGIGAFGGCSGLTTVVIPSSVSSIGAGAFEFCSGLTSVTIPSSVTSIGNYAFSSCSGLTEIITSNPNPVYFTPFAYVFEGVNKTSCTLYVPVGSKSAYQADNGWKDFTNIVEKDLTGIDPINNEKQLTAFPNPTTGIVKLTFDQIPRGGTYIVVNDVNGKRILKQFIQNKEEWIDLEGNRPGIYFVKTSLKNSNNQKIILK